ncbi:MAG TPA: zinc ribbon domain-containing protein [Chthoniobacterales bacterium]
MSVLKCPQCEYQNEEQRVYCHQCGTKLPQAGFAGGYGPAQNQPLRNTQPRQIQAASGSFFGRFFRVILWSAFVAALIQGARSPDDIPAPLPPGGGEAPNFTRDFQAAAAAPRRLVYQEQAVNAFLQSKLKARAGVLPAHIAHFERAFVNLGDGKLRLTKEYQLLGYPIYVAGVFKPSISGGALHVNTDSGAVGRLPIAGLIFDRIDTLVFSEFVEGLRAERAALATLKSVTIRPGEVEVASGP